MVQTVKSNPFLRQMTSNQAYRVNPQPRGFSSLGQQMNAQNLMGMANNQPRGNTPPNFKNNLLNYILSPRGKGMAQGLLESSGYSTKPVGMGEALARGLARSNESQRYADETAFKKQQYEEAKTFRDSQSEFQKQQYRDTKDFRNTQTAFQNRMMESEFGLKERKFLSDEELQLKQIGLTEDQIINAKENNVNLLAFKNKKLTQDESLALKGLGLQENQINNLENYRTKSLEFQDRKLTSDEDLALKKLGISQKELDLKGVSVENSWKLGMENIGIQEKQINNIAEYRANTLALQKDNLNFSEKKFDKDTELTLKKLGLTEKQINNAQEYNSERIRLQEQGLDIKRIVADANMIKANAIDNRTTKQKELDEYADLFGLDKTSPEFQEVFKQVMTKPSTVFNMGDKVGLEKEKSALKLVEADYNKNINASSNKVAINQMRSASESFKTGALADTRIFIGQAADLVGLDSISGSELLKPSSGEKFKAAQNKLVRQLADGLVNLNNNELIMLQNNYPKVSNTREGNALLFDIYEKEYDSQEKQLQIISEYYSSNMTLKEYNQANQKIKNDYSKEVKTILDEYNGGLNKFNKLITDNIGASGTGRDVNGESISITVQKGDTYLGLNENGMPMYSKPNGTQYSMIIEE